MYRVLYEIDKDDAAGVGVVGEPVQDPTIFSGSRRSASR
jgi:hypothetical protein